MALEAASIILLKTSMTNKNKMGAIFGNFK